jgi:hypothetical protein
VQAGVGAEAGQAQLGRGPGRPLGEPALGHEAGEQPVGGHQPAAQHDHGGVGRGRDRPQPGRQHRRGPLERGERRRVAGPGRLVQVPGVQVFERRAALC